MIPWLVDTLVVTGFLMAIVLLLRRPVARAFGPGVAYALWALPLIRLILPPLILPASFAAKSDVPRDIQQILTIAAPERVAEGATHSAGWSLTDWAIAIWLCGAAVLLVWRAWSYAAMRRRLLDGARPMGEADNVRIVESPAVTAPVAFGVFDKVVALPWGFMAHPDRRSRNFALEHEFEHHAGRDLAANFIFQPLLALHWFNPLGWLAWRAMRRDQEAACDARVMAGRSGAAREAYGRLIAGYAAGPRLALGAPMACPVLGEKSIVQRLRCLARPEVSSRRRAAGGALLAASAMTLPLTATISYADTELSPTVAAPPKDAPAGEHVVSVNDIDGADPATTDMHTRGIEHDGSTVVLNTPEPIDETEVEARIERAFAGMSGPDRWAPTPPAPPVPPAPPRLAVSVDAYEAGHRGDVTITIDDDCSDEAEAMVERAVAGKDEHRARALFTECTRRVANMHAIEGLLDARSDIEADDSMPEKLRRQLIESFDRKIASLSRRS